MPALFFVPFFLSEGLCIMLRMLTVGPYQANCYILGCKKTKVGLVIDPGDEVSRILTEISQLDLSIEHILITHGHIDHIGGAQELKGAIHASLYIHPLDAPGMNFPPDSTLFDGQTIPLGAFRISVIHTPGHSPGSVCFYAPGALFTGDTLFAGSVGRTDFPGGSHNKLIQGVVSKLFPLGDHIRVYPGHGPRSTIGKERLYNPFFQS